MPVTDHLKSAATELMKAVELLRHEIDDLRYEERNLRTMVERQIANLAEQMHLHNQELGRLQNGADNSQIRSAIRDIDVQIAQTKRQQQQEQNRIADAIRDREGMINSLQSQASNIMP